METSKIKLRYRDRDTLFKKEFSELRIKVALNWFEIIALITLTFLGSIKALLMLGVSSIPTNIVISFLISLLVAFMFSRFRNYQLKITRFDKEHIYKKISADLIDKTKS